VYGVPSLDFRSSAPTMIRCSSALPSGSRTTKPACLRVRVCAPTRTPAHK
jgi:hypothetical protein